MTFQDCDISSTGAGFKAALQFPRWLVIGKELLRVEAATAWWIGDWLNFGEKSYGEKYKDALSIVGLEYQTIREYGWVAASVAPAHRNDKLSWSHHRELAALDAGQQVKWLTAAADGKWSVSQLRQMLRSSLAQYNDPKEPFLLPFNPIKSITDLVRGFRQLEATKPVEQWPADHRSAWKHDLEPLMEFYRKL